MEEKQEQEMMTMEEEERERMIKEKEEEMRGKPWYSLVPGVPRSKWKRFTRYTSEEVKEVRDAMEALGLKRHREATDIDDLDPFGIREDLEGLPNFFLDYTAEDDRRFSEEMAYADKLMAEAEAEAKATPVGRRVPVAPPPPQVVLLPEDHRAAPGRVPEAQIKKIRHIATSRFIPVSERFLRQPLFTEAAARDIRECDRFISKVYSMSQELAASVLEEYDAKGYLDCDADGTITISNRRNALLLRTSDDASSSN